MVVSDAPKKNGVVHYTITRVLVPPRAAGRNLVNENPRNAQLACHSHSTQPDANESRRNLLSKTLLVAIVEV